MTADELDALEVLLKKATPGPYIIENDDASECGPHANSGLVMIRTVLKRDPRSVKGKFPYWPVLRLGEWPTTQYIVALLDAAPSLIESARREARLEALLRGYADSFECLCSDGTCWACRRDKEISHD